MRHCARAARYGPNVVLDGLVVSVLSICVGLYAGLLAGGLVRNIAAARLRWWGLVVLGVILPVVVDRTDPSRSVLLIVIALAALLLFARRNRHLPGMGVVAAGVFLNLLVVVVNGGMPVRADAVVAAGLATEDEIEFVEISGVQRLEEPGDRLMFLADVIPLEATRQVLSVGDLVILGGLGVVAGNLVRGRARPPATPSPRATPPIRDTRPARERRIPDFEPIVLGSDDLAGHEHGQTGPALGDRTQAGAGVGVPVLGKA
jgi:hypothetical protein